MLGNLFRFISKGKASSQITKVKSDSAAIYNGIRKELDSKNKHLAYIVERIRSLKWPFDFSDDLIVSIANESLKGRRSNDIANDISKFFENITVANAKVLVSTVSSIQSAQITRLRAENLGIKAYTWRSSEDSRVRSSHKHMDGVIVFWTDPPSPEELVGEKSIGYYHAGECVGCRCYAEPLVDIKYIKKSSLKVYYNGKITRISKAQFKELFLK
ncbi:minor capsid protein [Desulfosporosinus sp. FKB]|uniref:minor capsid protein n=1 Tax=Desulfosporosinus sp. FKB TaxID=1969835 RepID=UPI000B497501|nr:minor capsid protein [Desulfosporosinus sp. FKB]